MAMFTWNGSSADINIASDWSPTGGPPGATDIANISGGIISGAREIGLINMTGGATFTGQITADGEVGSGNQLTAFSVNGGTTIFTGAGASLKAKKDTIVSGAAGTALTFMAGATANFQSNDVTPEAGLYAGFNSGEVGTVTIDGNGTTATSDNGVLLGYFGNGTLTVSNAATFTIHISSANFGFYIGYQNGGVGTFNLNSGAQVTGDAFADIGAFFGATGTATIDGKDTSWTQKQDIAVGFAGTGNLTVRNQASVKAEGLVFGAEQFSSFNVATITSGARSG
jgi:T5SS/PEP-CTERM-associated repeat protein